MTGISKAVFLLHSVLAKEFAEQCLKKYNYMEVGDLQGC